MDDYNIKILKKINRLQTEIESGEFAEKAKRTMEWGGADVIVSNEMTPRIEKFLGDQNMVISLQKIAPRRRAVITPYAKELSQLFSILGGIFHERIDFASKYDFYGFLAQSALDYIDETKGDYECNQLLIAVLDGAKGFVKE